MIRACTKMLAKSRTPPAWDFWVLDFKSLLPTHEVGWQAA
jgi:hypothetical protein